MRLILNVSNPTHSLIVFI